MPKIKIKNLKNYEFKSIQKFIKENYYNKHIFTYNAVLFNFQYKHKKKYNFLLAKLIDKILGIQGYIDYNIYDTSIKNRQIFLALLNVSKSSEIGVSLRLHKEIIKLTNPDFVGVVGINERAHKFHKWLGFKVKLMNHHVLLSPYIRNFKIAQINDLEIKTLILKENTNSYIKISKTNINTLVENNFYKIQHPTKSNLFIINRYLKHPYYKYLVFLTFNRNQPAAIFVIRPIKVKDRYVLRIIDFIGLNKNFKTVINLANALMLQYKAEYLDCYSHGIPNSIFKQSHFIECYNNKDYLIPNHFEPFENKKIEIYCAYKSHINFKNIKIFKGDGDGDRPSILL